MTMGIRSARDGTGSETASAGGSSDRPARDDIVAIQALRWFAASLVVWGHSEHELVKVAHRHGRSLRFGRLVEFGVGVDIFFLISGFLIFFVSRELFGRPGASVDFLVRRVIRIVPLYWLATALMLLATLAVPSLLNHEVLALRGTVSSFLMLASPDPDGAVFPLLASGWTLNLEFFFYVLFAIALGFRARVGMPALLLFLGVAVAIDQAWSASPWWLDFYAQPIVLEFGAGIVLCELHRRGIRLSAAASLSGVALAIALHLAFGTTAHPPRILGNGVPAAILFVSLVFARNTALGQRPAKFLRLMGDASYALYLTSPFSINAAVEIMTRAGVRAIPALLLASYLVSLFAALATHLFVERRLTRLCRRIVRGGRLRPAAVASAGQGGPEVAAA